MKAENREVSGNYLRESKRPDFCILHLRITAQIGQAAIAPLIQSAFVLASLKMF